MIKQNNWKKDNNWFIIAVSILEKNIKAHNFSDLKYCNSTFITNIPALVLVVGKDRYTEIPRMSGPAFFFINIGL